MVNLKAEALEDDKPSAYLNKRVEDGSVSERTWKIEKRLTWRFEGKAKQVTAVLKPVSRATSFRRCGDRCGASQDAV